jgi:hypothetical protein
VHKELGIQYAKFIHSLRCIDELASLPATADEATREVARLVYKQRSGTHPIRHLAMIAWLFGDFLKFTARYAEVQKSPLPERLATSTIQFVESATQTDTRPDQVVALIRQSGFTPSAAARIVGVDTTTAMIWAASAGIPTKKRPSKIKPDCKAKMIRALRRGVDKVIVAKIGGLSVVSVTRMLGTEVGLRAQWTEARLNNAKNAARKRWLRAASSNPLSGVKAVRLLEPAAYSLLYRNDKTWLDSQINTLQKAVRGNNSSVSWDSRDADLSQAVRETCLEIGLAGPGAHIKLWQIYQRLPELKAKLAKLDRLPLTHAAIKTALSAAPLAFSKAGGNLI